MGQKISNTDIERNQDEIVKLEEWISNMDHLLQEGVIFSKASKSKMRTLLNQGLDIVDNMNEDQGNKVIIPFLE